MPSTARSTSRTCAILMLPLVAVAAGSRPVSAEPPADTIPPALKTYKGREIARTMHYAGAPWLVREVREREEDCATLLAQLQIESGQTVCDLGCGNGFYTLRLSPLVGKKGRVLAVDIQSEMLRLLEARADERELENIDTILGTVVDPRLPEGKVDLVLLVDVYHEFSHPENMLREIRKSLSPRGRIALAEFRTEDPDVPIKRLHKMSKAQIMKEYPANGLKLVGQFDGLPWQHLMFFARDDSPLEAMEWKPATDEKKPGDARRNAEAP